MQGDSFLSELGNPIRILVVDSSRTYGTMVREALLKHVKNVAVDVATNVWELKRRLEKKGKYQLIVADLSVAFDGEEMSCYLYDTDSMVILWSAFKASDNGNGKVPFRQIKKPVSMDEMRDVAPLLVGYGSSAVIPAIGMAVQP
jgi:hypothetical protein